MVNDARRPAELLRTSGLTFRHPETELPAVAGISLAVHAGEVLVVLGPNGSGKSTLLALCCGLLRPDAGEVHVLGDRLDDLPRRERARRLARVPQDLERWPRQTLGDFVAGARYAHRRHRLGQPSATDRAAIDRALDAVGARRWHDRPLGTLSGGERQRALVARALAQEPAVLLCDEPTASLDIGAQVEVLELLIAASRTERAQRGLLLVTHDLNLAAQFADRLVLLRAGSVAAEGVPDAVLRPAVLAPVYGEALHHDRLPADGRPGGGRPLVVPRRGSAPPDPSAQPDPDSSPPR